MEIKETKDDEILVLELCGRLDSATSEDLETLVSAKLVDGETRFLIDLRELEYVSSAGLRVFVMLAKKLIPKQGKAVLCSPTEAVQEIFDMVRLSQLLHLVDSRETALAELRG
jgi:anti-anti-sigma factor